MSLLRNLNRKGKIHTAGVLAMTSAFFVFMSSQELLLAFVTLKIADVILRNIVYNRSQSGLSVT